MHIHRAERIWLWFGGVMLAVFLATITTVAIVEGMVPPSHIQSIDPTKVAETPPFDHPGLRKLPDGTYEAYYVAHIFAFDPQTLVIPRGAHVTFYVTSPDVDARLQHPAHRREHDGDAGLGQHGLAHVRAAGTFLLVCNEYCGSAHHLMAGKIEVREMAVLTLRGGRLVDEAAHAHAAENRLVLAHIYTSTIALAVGALFGLLQGFSRANWLVIPQ